MSGLYKKGIEAILGATTSLTADTIKAELIDLGSYGKAITGATNATPIVVTATSHGYSNGDIVTQSNVGGNTAANGRFKVANKTANTYELTDPYAGTNVAGTGAYTSGGYAVSLMSDQFLSDIPSGARLSMSGAITTKTVTSGVFDGDDVTFTTPVAGSNAHALAVIKDTGVVGTSPLLALIDSGTGLPLLTNGANINITWANTADKIINFDK